MLGGILGASNGRAGQMELRDVILVGMRPGRPARCLFARLGGFDNVILAHPLHDPGKLPLGQRCHGEPDPIKTARRWTVDQSSLILLQKIRDLSGARLSREAHHRESAIAVLDAQSVARDRTWRFGENVHQHERLQRDGERRK